MHAPLETIIRAACGDAQALADIACTYFHDRYAVVLLTAVVLAIPTIILGQESCADLRAALAPLLSRIWNALAPPYRAARSAAGVRRHNPAGAHRRGRVKQTPPEERATLL